MIAALDGLFLGEPLSSATSILGKPQPAVFRQMPAYQWKQTSGLVITVITGRDGSITLVDETATTGTQPTGLAEEDARESALLFNVGVHSDLALNAPSTVCTGDADCYEFHYDRNVLMRTDFIPSGGALREVTLADQTLLKELRFDS